MSEKERIMHSPNSFAGINEWEIISTRKRKKLGKIVGTLFVYLIVGLILTAFSGLIGTVDAASFSIGDTVEVTANLNVRTGAGTSYSEITDSDYPGYAPTGTIGKILSGPSSADGYIWWKVDFGPGWYCGWSVEDGFKAEEKQKAEFNYFSLAVGNSWTYKCTIRPGCQPLFSLVAEVEKPHPSQGHKQGDWIWKYGRCYNAKSGIETYTISEYDKSLDAFRVIASEGAIDDRKYSLQELDGVYWRYNDYGVWEVVRARDLGETILVNGFIAFLKPREGQEEMLERKQKITCDVAQGTVEVPAGRFTDCLRNVTTQLGGTQKQQIKTVSYFARNVGLVKETQYDSRGNETYSLELTSFSVESEQLQMDGIRREILDAYLNGESKVKPSAEPINYIYYNSSSRVTLGYGTLASVEFNLQGIETMANMMKDNYVLVSPLGTLSMIEPSKLKENFRTIREIFVGGGTIQLIGFGKDSVVEERNAKILHPGDDLSSSYVEEKLGRVDSRIKDFEDW